MIQQDEVLAKKSGNGRQLFVAVIVAIVAPLATGALGIAWNAATNGALVRMLGGVTKQDVAFIKSQTSLNAIQIK